MSLLAWFLIWGNFPHLDSHQFRYQVPPVTVVWRESDSIQCGFSLSSLRAITSRVEAIAIGFHGLACVSARLHPLVPSKVYTLDASGCSVGGGCWDTDGCQ